MRFSQINSVHSQDTSTTGSNFTGNNFTGSNQKPEVNKAEAETDTTPSSARWTPSLTSKKTLTISSETGEKRNSLSEAFRFLLFRRSFDRSGSFVRHRDHPSQTYLEFCCILRFDMMDPR